MSPPAVEGPRRAALAFVFVTVTLDMLAFGVMIPVLPHLVRDLVGGDTATASRWGGVFGTVFALAQFVCSPIQGALSDRFGRRPVILLSNLGLAADFVLMALAQSLPVLFVGRLISGITAASLSTSNAYIADVTPAEKRAGAFGMLGAAFGIGFVVGPAMGSLLSMIHVRAPFWGAAALAATNFLYGLFVLPESLPPERRSPRFDLSSANPLGAIGNLRRYPSVLGLVAVIFLFNLAHHVYPSTFVLYADYRYAWNERSVGYVLAGAGIGGALVQAVLSGRVVAWLGERRTVLIGMCCGVIGFAIYGLAPTGALFLVGLPFNSLWGLASPPTQAMASRAVGPAEQGRLQGAITSLTSTSGIFAPTLYSWLFAAVIAPDAAIRLPGAPWLLSSAFVALAGLVALWATRGEYARGVPEVAA